MNFVFAVVIGLVIGGVGGYFFRQRHSNAIWLAPVLAVAGSAIASILATLFGDAGYGPKEATLQVVLAAAGVGVAAALGMRRPTPAA
jgi:formate-dependent nitrite reductase membrane component NrfD